MEAKYVFYLKCRLNDYAKPFSALNISVAITIYTILHGVGLQPVKFSHRTGVICLHRPVRVTSFTLHSRIPNRLSVMPCSTALQ